MNFDSSEVLAVIYPLHLTIESKKEILALRHISSFAAQSVLPGHKLLVGKERQKSFDMWARPRPLVSLKHLEN